MFYSSYISNDRNFVVYGFSCLVVIHVMLLHQFLLSPSLTLLLTLPKAPVTFNR